MFRDAYVNTTRIISKRSAQRKEVSMESTLLVAVGSKNRVECFSLIWCLGSEIFFSSMHYFRDYLKFSLTSCVGSSTLFDANLFDLFDQPRFTYSPSVTSPNIRGHALARDCMLRWNCLRNRSEIVLGRMPFTITAGYTSRIGGRRVINTPHSTRVTSRLRRTKVRRWHAFQGTCRRGEKTKRWGWHGSIKYQ